jgi:hypothetical protein
MQKVNVTLTFEDEKLRALETYLKLGDSSLQKKLEAALSQLYEQVVPKPVQEYVDAISGTKSKRPSSPPKAPSTSGEKRSSPSSPPAEGEKSAG